MHNTKKDQKMNALVFTSEEQKLIVEVKNKLTIANLSSKYPDIADLLPKLNDFMQRSEVNDDVFYVRWLRAYSGNVDKTISGIIELIRWRQRMNLDQSKLTRFVELFPKLEEFLCFMGSDKEGLLIIPIIQYINYIIISFYYY